MRARLTRQLNLSRNLSILRAFVDAIHVWNGDVMVSVAYRRGRAFCRYDRDLQLVARVEEKNLRRQGFGDFRCSCVDPEGNMLVAGSHRPDTVTIFRIDRNGDIAHLRSVTGFPLLMSMAADGQGNLYLHSPLMPFPVYRIPHDSDEKWTGIGSFPDGSACVEDRIGRVTVDSHGSITFVLENYPAYLYKFDWDGKEIIQKHLDKAAPSIDLWTRVLDVSADPQNETVHLLRETGRNRRRVVEVIDRAGACVGSYRLSRLARRIGVAGNGVVYSSETRFGIGAIIMAMGIYGAITTLDENVIPESIFNEAKRNDEGANDGNPQ